MGVSEATDSMTVIVSEETGQISVAYEGSLSRGLTGTELEEELKKIQNKPDGEKEPKKQGWQSEGQDLERTAEE